MSATQFMKDIGDRISNDFELLGMFGVDAIANEKGAWVVEVNPRTPILWNCRNAFS